jgi:hypothetical protein
MVVVVIVTVPSHLLQLSEFFLLKTTDTGTAKETSIMSLGGCMLTRTLAFALLTIKKKDLGKIRLYTHSASVLMCTS